MKLSSAGAGLNQQPPEGEQNCLNSELWHACAGPLVSLPAIGSHVVYFPQGHSEQVAVSTNKEVDAQIPNYPSLPPQLICQLHNVTMHADIETDEVYAQMTLQPLSPQEQKEVSFLPIDLGCPSKQPTNYFCKTLTASDTSTHGGFSVPRRAAEKVFPPLDFSQQPPCQELIARDLHNNDWKFRHIFRGQPKRHLLTTGWSVFVSAKRLVAGDSVLFIWYADSLSRMRNEKNQLLLGIRRANRPQTVMPSSVLSSDSMHLGLLAAAAHAAATNSRFTIFYNPRASPSEFVIPLAKYVKAVYHTRVSVGMRFRMLFETEESSVRRYMGTITGISDLDPVKWPNSHWRSVKVGWDESAAGDRQPRVSLWEIEPLTTFPMYPSPFPLRLKRPWPPGLPTFTGMKNDDMSSLMWLRGDVADRGMQSLNFQGMGLTPWMQPRIDSSMLGMQNDIYQAMAAAALQEMRVVDPSKQMLSSIMQFQQPQAVGCRPPSLVVPPQILQQSQSTANSSPLLQQTLPGSQPQGPTQSHANLMQQQLLHQDSFNKMQQLQQQQQSSPLQQQVIDSYQLSPNQSQMSSNSYSQPQMMQSTSSMHQNFSESNFKPVAANMTSPLHSLVGSVSQDEASNLFSGVSKSSNLLSSSGGWPTKRVALDPLLSAGGVSHGVSVSSHVNHLGGPSSTSMSPVPVSLPPFPGRDCLIEQEGNNDPSQNNLLFGVNIDSSSLLMPNGMSNGKGVGAVCDNETVPFASNTFMSSSTTDYSLNPSVASCGGIDESAFLHASDNLGQANTPNRTFVKVYKSGSFGRSLDITKFSSYPQLRYELAQMFGLEGQLEDPVRSGWQLVFVDRENDVLLLGDDPWQEFVNNVWCIKILSPQEVQEMGKRRLELLNSVPVQGMPIPSNNNNNNGNCDGHTTGRQDPSRSMNAVMTLPSSVGTWDS